MCEQGDHDDQNQGFPVSLGSETAIVLGQFLNSPINKHEQTVKEPDSRANYYYQVLIKQLNYFNSYSLSLVFVQLHSQQFVCP